jgi:hypothetical protein
MTDDPQDVAESLDLDKIVGDDDLTGDEFGEGLIDYPPDRPMGVGTVGVTPAEEDAGESFAERTSREEPDDLVGGGLDVPEVGSLVDPDAMDHDDEEQLIAEMEPATELSAEESAIHIETEPDAGAEPR